MSDEAGPIESWVAGFPSPTDKRQVATHAAPLSWRADGREILLIDVKGDLSAVSVTMTGGRISVGMPSPLARGVPGVSSFNHATRDHARVLTLAPSNPERGTAEIQLWTGWLASVR